MAKQPAVTEVADDWREKFRRNGTRITFRLMLTRPMLEMLCALSENVHWDRQRHGSILYPDNFLGTEHALTERGLVQRKPLRIVNGYTEVKEGEPPIELTPAGRSLVDLLKVGGFYIEAKAAAEKMAARKGRN